MRIENITGVNRLQKIRLRGVEPADEVSSSGLDAVQLSARAADVRAAMEALAAAPEVREERVLELRRQLDQGSFDTQPEALAEKLLERKA